MKIGLSSWTYAWAIGVSGFEKPQNTLGLFDLLERAVSLGVDVLQVADNLPLTNYTTAELIRFAHIARENRVDIEVGTRGLNPGNLFTYLKIAEIVGAKLVRTLPHDGTDRPDLDEAKKRLEIVLPEFIKEGVVLGIENHDFYKTSWLKELIENFGHEYLGICLDTVNNFGQGESFNEVIDNLGKYTVNFHCKDYTIKRKPSMLGFDVTGTPVGYGLLDLLKAKNILKDDVSWIIELWTPFVDNIISTLALENDWAEKSVVTLKFYQNMI